MRGVVLAACMAVGLVVGGHSGVAAAQGADSAALAAARKVGYEGVEAFQAGEYAVATEKLEKAYAVVRVPSLGLWSARALVKVGKLIEATERYLEVTRLPLGSGDQEIQEQARVDAQAEAEATQTLLPSLRVDIRGAHPDAVKVTIDGVVVPKQMVGEATPVNPGKRVVEGTLEDGQTVSTLVPIALKEQRTATLSFGPAEASPGAESFAVTTASAPPHDTTMQPSSGRRTVGWVLVAVGGAGVVVGGVAGGLSLKKSGDLDDQGCRDQQCPKRLSSEVGSLNTVRTVSTVGLLAGTLVATTGVVLVLTAPKATTTASLRVAPNGLALAGAF